MFSIHKLKNPYLRTMRIFFVIFFAIAGFIGSAQPVNLRDSFKGVFDENPKATAKWDTWGTFIGGPQFGPPWPTNTSLSLVLIRRKA